MSASVAADNVRIWLHSKLEKPWCGFHVAYHLTSDVLGLVVNQWATLDTTLKLRLLVALLAVKPAQMSAIQTETQQIVALTAEDSDGWVQTIGQIVSTALVPENPHFCLSALDSNPETSSLLQNIRQLVKEHTTVEFAPLEAAYAESPKFKPAPNIHFSVKNPMARTERPKDLTTSTNELSHTTVHARPNLALSGGIRNSSSNFLSSSVLSYGGSSSLLSAPSGPSKYSSSILSQTSRFEGRRPYAPAAPTADTGLMIVDQVAVFKEKAEKEAEEKKRKEDEKKRKEEEKQKRKRDREDAAANKLKAAEEAKGDLSSDKGSGKPIKKRKTAETADQMQDHKMAPMQGEIVSDGRVMFDALLNAAQSPEETLRSAPPQLSIPSGPHVLPISSTSPFPGAMGVKAPVTTFNARPEAPTGLGSINMANIAKPAALVSKPSLTSVRPSSQVTFPQAPTTYPAATATESDAHLLATFARSAPNAMVGFPNAAPSGPSQMPKMPIAPIGYMPTLSGHPASSLVTPPYALKGPSLMSAFANTGLAGFNSAVYPPNLATMMPTGIPTNFVPGASALPHNVQMPLLPTQAAPQTLLPQTLLPQIPQMPAAPQDPNRK